MVAYLLRIGISDEIALLGSLLFIKDFKHYLIPYLRGCRLRQYPCRVEILYRLNTWQDGGLQPRWCQYHEILCKSLVVRLIAGEIEVDVYKGCHKVCFTRTHGQAKNVIGVSDSIKDITEHLLVFYAVGFCLYSLFEFGKEDFSVICFEARILIQRRCCVVVCQHFPGAHSQRHVIDVDGQEVAFTE